MGQYSDAARTAIIIGREETAQGNYKSAHDFLFACIRDLKARKSHVSLELESLLMLLHSYSIVKSLIKLEYHETSARMLRRVSMNISTFSARNLPSSFTCVTC